MYRCFSTKLILILFITGSICQKKAYSQICIDTINSKQFEIENFGGSFAAGSYQDSLDNFYIMGNIRPVNPTFDIKSTLVKFNGQKKIIWSKSYKGNSGPDQFAFFRRFFGVDKEQNLYYSSNGLGSSFVNYLKIDSNGLVLANKVLSVPINGNSYFGSRTNAGILLSTIINSFFTFNAREANFVGTEKNLNSIRWSKVYIPNLTNFIYASPHTSIEIDDSTSIISTNLIYRNPVNLADTIRTFHLLKISSVTGDILQQRSISVFDPQNPVKTLNISHWPRNINYTNKEVIYQIGRSVTGGNVYGFFTIDSNLNIIKTANYFTNIEFNSFEFNALNNNEIILNGNGTINSISKLFTIKWNTNLQLISQKSYYSNQFSGNLYTNLTYKNTNNTISYYVANNSFFSPTSTPIYLFDNTKNPNFEFDCSDKDVIIFQPTAPFIFQTDASSFISQRGLNYQIINNPNTYTIQNNLFSEQKYCDLVSICSSLKIHGKTSFCLNSSNIDSFRILRNNGCLRKTAWTVDNSQIQILQSSDTSATVKFLRPFKGYIKASYENCLVMDSMYIEVDTVYDMKTGVYLGPDTIQCMGKSITFSAGSGFRSYEWQDGSNLNTFTTNDRGMFHVKVVDSCGMIYRDSVIISENPKQLNITYSGRLCEYDTAKISLPAEFNDYTWQPLSSTLRSGNILMLFPTETTVYSIIASPHNNCFVVDTLLIRKNDCYGSLYFPNAFTPNNDGKNDLYKASAIGILQSYNLTIYNRYGNIVFHSKDINNGWNGKYQDKVLPGTYTWVCTYRFRSRKDEIGSGSFILLQ